MTKSRMAATAVTAACAMLLIGGAGTASAQEPLAFAKKVPVTGETKNGRQFEGTYTIKRFIRREGRAWAVGTLRGELKNRRVVRRGVRMPVAAAGQPAGSTSAQPPLPVPTPGACTILNLTLGPINLNLLGNLLCAITNLLNPSANTPLSQLVQVLNALLALAPRNAAAA
jgi:hypothetical protein